MNDFLGMEKVSLVDYEGKVATTLFFGGCNFRCPFCHNKDLVLNQQNINEINFDDILKYLESRKGIIDAVVISGGEPTLNKTLKEKIIEIKNMGFLIKLDTNGYNYEILKDLLDNKLIDYVAMDIKCSLKKYPLVANIMNFKKENILNAIEIIKTSGIEYEFRTTLVDEYFEKEDIIEISNLIKDSNAYYLQKYVSRDTCIDSTLHEVNIKKALEYQDLLKKNIKNTFLRGY